MAADGRYPIQHLIACDIASDSDDADSFYTVFDEPEEINEGVVCSKVEIYDETSQDELGTSPEPSNIKPSITRSQISDRRLDHHPSKRAPRPIRRSTYPRRPSSRTPEETKAFHILSCELFSSFDNDAPTHLLQQPQIIHTDNGFSYLSTTSPTSSPVPWIHSRNHSSATLRSNRHQKRSSLSRQNSLFTSPTHHSHRRSHNNSISAPTYTTTTSARSSIFSPSYGLQKLQALTPSTPSLASLPSLTYMPSPLRPSSSSSQSPTTVPENNNTLLWMSPNTSSCGLGYFEGSRGGLKGFCKRVLLPSRWVGSSREKRGPRRRIIVD